MMRILNIFAGLLTLAVAFTAYHVKYATLAEQREVRRIKAEIAENEDAVQVLRAEWSLLNQPERLEHLAAKYTEVTPMDPAQIVSFNDLPGRPGDPELEIRSRTGGVAALSPRANPLRNGEGSVQ